MTALAIRRQNVRCAMAFSMLEMVLVIGIMAVMAAIASPRYGSAVARYRGQTAAQRIVRDLNAVRDKAWSTGSCQTVIFSPSTDSYRIVGMARLDGQPGDYTVVLTDEPHRATITSAVFGTDAAVVFNGYGVPDTGGTVCVQAGGYQYTVILDAEIGKASIQ